jgi:hypothetical protein
MKNMFDDIVLKDYGSYRLDILYKKNKDGYYDLHSHHFLSDGDIRNKVKKYFDDFVDKHGSGRKSNKSLFIEMSLTFQDEQMKYKGLVMNTNW